jgi:hypothetical protein
LAEIVKKRSSLKSSDSDAVTAGPATAKRPRGIKPVDVEPPMHWPAEGPHARADLINEAATPGAGLFSSRSTGNDDVDPGAG